LTALRWCLNVASQTMHMMMCAVDDSGTVTSRCSGRFSFPGRGLLRGLMLMAQKPQGHRSLVLGLNPSGFGGGRGNLVRMELPGAPAKHGRSMMSLSNCDACKDASHSAHQSSNRQSPGATMGFRWQLLHLGSEGAGSAFSAGEEAEGAGISVIAVVPPHNAFVCCCVGADSGCKGATAWPWPRTAVPQRGG